MSDSGTTTVEHRERLLTTREVADWVGVDVHTVHRWRWDGRGPRFLRVESGYRYRVSDIEDWLARER
jgi:predicted DNA-binding transcriptional regulator AlpA